MVEIKKCFYCGILITPKPGTLARGSQTFESETLDHVIPRHVRPGLRERDGSFHGKSVSACMRCNSLKGTNPLGQFIAECIPCERWPLIDWDAIYHPRYTHFEWHEADFWNWEFVEES